MEMKLKYTKVKTIGSGNYCTVWDVADRQNKRYAFKELLPHHLDEPIIVNRFRREIRLLSSRLKNREGIIPVVDYSLEQNHLYLVMPIALTTLEGFLQSSSPSEETVAAWFMQIAAGVGNSHDAGIMHRDMKPSNILLFSEDVVYQNRLERKSPSSDKDNQKKSLVATVADFGLGLNAFPNGTGTPETIGTLRYTAPEVIAKIHEGKGKHISAGQWVANDVFALGKILYEMLIPLSARSASTGGGQHGFNTDLVPIKYRGLVDSMCDKDETRRTNSLADVRVAFLKIWSGTNDARSYADQAVSIVAKGERRMPVSLIGSSGVVSLLIIRLCEYLHKGDGILETIVLIRKSVPYLRGMAQVELLRLIEDMVSVFESSPDAAIKVSIVEVMADLAGELVMGDACSACWRFIANSALHKESQVREVAVVEFKLFCASVRNGKNGEGGVMFIQRLVNEHSMVGAFWRKALGDFAEK